MAGAPAWGIFSTTDTRIDGSPSLKMRSSIANDAALEPTDRTPVIGVGGPSYESAARKGNGAAAILKLMPATARMRARISRESDSCPARAVAIVRRLVEPDKPYISDIPYSRIPRENAPSRKYF